MIENLKKNKFLSLMLNENISAQSTKHARIFWWRRTIHNRY